MTMTLKQLGSEYLSNSQALHNRIWELRQVGIDKKASPRKRKEYYDRLSALSDSYGCARAVGEYLVRYYDE